MYKLVFIDPRRGKNSIVTFRTRYQSLKRFDEAINRDAPRGLGLKIEFHSSRGLMCQHCYDAPLGSPDNWVGRVLEIPFPSSGRPASASPKKSRSLSLSDGDFEIATTLGNGNASAGVSKALRIAKASRSTFDID